MTATALIPIVTLIALILLGLALLLSAVRVIIGPTLADRVLALDLMTVVAMGFVVAIAIRTGLTLYLDIAISLALLGFLATIAFARYMLSRSPNREPPQ